MEFIVEDRYQCPFSRSLSRDQPPKETSTPKKPSISKGMSILKQISIEVCHSAVLIEVSKHLNHGKESSIACYESISQHE